LDTQKKIIKIRKKILFVKNTFKMKKQTAKSSKFKVLFSYKVLKETAYGMQVS
jgi:hypothetical protein